MLENSGGVAVRNLVRAVLSELFVDRRVVGVGSYKFDPAADFDAGKF